MPNPTRLYFAYGSNMDVQQMSTRCPDAELIRPVRLDGYRLAYRGAGYATILPEPGSHVDGALWRITAWNERDLDRYEGFPRHYGKELITVTARDGMPYTAMVYTMQAPMRDLPAIPPRQYLDIVLRGKRQFGFSLSEASAEVERARKEVFAAPVRGSEAPRRDAPGKAR